MKYEYDWIDYSSYFRKDKRNCIKKSKPWDGWVGKKIVSEKVGWHIFAL